MNKLYKTYIFGLLAYSLTALAMFYATNPLLLLIIVVLPVALVIAVYALVYMWLNEIVKILKVRETR